MFDLQTSGSKYASANNWVSVNNTEATSYAYSGWVYAQGSAIPEIWVAMRTATETGYFTSYSKVRTYVKNQWVHLEKTVEVPANIVELFVIVKNLNGNGTVWFDDIKVEKLSESEIVEENNYYPFGLQHKGYNKVSSSSLAEKWKYNGKELNEELGLNWYDYGARMYDPALGRWFVNDKLADDEMQIDKSPYAYSWNSPILLNDPDGNCPWCIGALVGALVDVAVQAIEISLDDNKTIDDFSITSVIISAGAGATGVGLATKLKKAKTLTKLAIEATTDAAASAGTQLAKDGEVNVKDVIIDVTASQTVGKIIGNGANGKFLKSGKGKNLKEGVNQQKNAKRGKSNTISKSKADVKGAENKLTKAAAARTGGASTASSSVVSTSLQETKKAIDTKEEK